MTDGIARSGEFELIARYLAPLAAAAPLAFGLTDDAALLAPEPGEQVVLTKDCMVAGVHFLDADGPEVIARKLLRTNLSDLAAMGATPRGYLLGLVLPRGFDEAWIAGFARGLALDQQEFGVALLGGDTTATSGPTVLSLTALGVAPQGRVLRRNGARAGDLLYVSGTIGDAALALHLKLGQVFGIDPEIRAALNRRLDLPSPRVGLGPRLVGIATAALDVSDGLVQDVGHIARASGVAIEIAAAELPLSPGAAEVIGEEGPELFLDCLSGGDDYELAFTAPAGRAAEVAAAAAAAGVAVTCIGRVAAGQGVTVRDRQGDLIELARPGYRHF